MLPKGYKTERFELEPLLRLAAGESEGRARKGEKEVRRRGGFKEGRKKERRKGET